MKAWIKKTDDRESVDDSELNDLTVTAFQIFKKKRQSSYIAPPSIACQSLVRFLSVLLLNLKKSWHSMNANFDMKETSKENCCKIVTNVDRLRLFSS
jgi:hypothetical protein